MWQMVVRDDEGRGETVKAPHIIQSKTVLNIYLLYWLVLFLFLWQI